MDQVDEWNHNAAQLPIAHRTLDHHQRDLQAIVQLQAAEDDEKRQIHLAEPGTWLELFDARAELGLLQPTQPTSNLW